MTKFLSLFCFLLCFGCYKTERNCTDFKTGTFSFNYIENGQEKTATFTRNDTLSIDYINGKADSSSVRWINDCEFILKKLHPSTIQEEKAIHMKILSTTDTSYTFGYKYAVKDLNKPNRTERGVATRVR